MKKIPLNKTKIFQSVFLKQPLKEKINFLNTIKDYYTEPLRLSGKPIFIQIEPTTFCNLKCDSCYNPFLKNRKNLSYQEFVQILTQLPYLRKINLVGMGEPLLNPDLSMMISYAFNKDIAVGIATNGILLSKMKSLELLKSGTRWINISLDSTDPDQLNAIRPDSDYYQIIQNIKDLIQNKAQLDSSCEIGLSVVAGTHNLSEIEKIIELAGEIGILKVFIQTIHFWGETDFYQKLKDQSLVNQIERFKETFIHARQFASRKKVQLQIENLPDTSTSRFCKWPWKSCYITSAGYVTPCCMHGSNPEHINFGNILEENFETIWNREQFQEFRRQLKSATPPEICRNCPSYHRSIFK